MPSKSLKLAACVGKVAFETASLAQRVARRRARSKAQAKGKVYRCQHCGKWHLGRPSAKVSNNRGWRV